VFVHESGIFSHAAVNWSGVPALRGIKLGQWNIAWHQSARGRVLREDIHRISRRWGDVRTPRRSRASKLRAQICSVAAVRRLDELCAITATAIALLTAHQRGRRRRRSALRGGSERALRRDTAVRRAATLQPRTAQASSRAVAYGRADPMRDRRRCRVTASPCARRAHRDLSVVTHLDVRNADVVGNNHRP
jgi:hypothetical protein